MRAQSAWVLVAVCLTTTHLVSADPLGTAFTYQGQLKKDGAAFTGTIDLSATLYDTLIEGTGIAEVDIPNVMVTNGLFTVRLDFGTDPFKGDARFLELSVRAAGDPGFTSLAPRQELTATPYALFALDSPNDFDLPLAVTLPSVQDLFSLTNSMGAPSGGGALVGRASGSNPAVRGVALGDGNAGRFESFVAGGTASVLEVFTTSDGEGFKSQTQGGGSAGVFVNGAASNASTALRALTNGMGRAAHFEIQNAAGTSVAVEVTSNATEDGLYSRMTGAGRAGFFEINVPTPADNSSAALNATTNGANSAGFFRIAVPNPADNSFPALEARTNGNGEGVKGVAPNNDGVFGDTNRSGTFALGPASVKAGVHGDGAPAQGSTDNFGVAGTQDSYGSGVLGIGEQAGHGVVGVSGSTFQAPPRSLAGVWGMTREDSGGGFTWPPHFNIEGTTGAKGLIGVLGQAVNHVGVWGESLNRIGLVGTSGEAFASAILPFFPVGVYGHTSTPSGRGVYGKATGGSGFNVGVEGECTSSGAGVLALATATAGTNYGVFSQTDSGSGKAVYGVAAAFSGENYGGHFESNGTSGRGVYGVATATSGTTYGGRFESRSGDGTAVHGLATRTTGDSFGGQFESRADQGTGVEGVASSTSGATFGVHGLTFSPNGTAVLGHDAAGSGSAFAVHGISDSPQGRGVFGHATGTSAENYGLYGRSDGLNGKGVYGHATALTTAANGVLGEADGSAGIGVYGRALHTSGNNYGVIGQSESSAGTGVWGRALASTGSGVGGQFESNGTSGTGVFGRAAAGSGNTSGVYGESASPSGRGVHGKALGLGASAYGVIGEANAPGIAVHALGNMAGSGVKAFRIDHPLDPENAYLCHYSTEAPEPLNAYSGTVTLDAVGEAWVQLPHYFAEINRDPRYTLTAIGAAMPNLHIAEEIQANRFRIAGGAAGKKVSWRVEAVRSDPFVRRYGAPTEVAKDEHERGKVQHPELYGLPTERGLNYRPEPELASAEQDTPHPHTEKAVRAQQPAPRRQLRSFDRLALTGR